jgi:hypothetical protein
VRATLLKRLSWLVALVVALAILALALLRAG